MVTFVPKIRQKMEKSAMPLLGVSELEHQQHYSWNDGDAVVIDNISDLPADSIMRTDHIIHIVCTRGRFQLDYNGRTYSFGEGEVFVIQPQSVVANYMVSPDMQCRILSVRYEPFSNLLYVNKKVWDDIQWVRHNPILTISAEERSHIFRIMDCVKEKVADDESSYYGEVMRALFSALLFEFMAVFERHADRERIADEGSYAQGDLLVKRFLELVHQHAGHVRSVAEYAEMLNITPKYLSALVKKSSGSNALDIISQATVQAIETRLRYSDMSAKEIATEFDFPNLSFFGRYVKEHLGMSPTEFRKSMAK